MCKLISTTHTQTVTLALTVWYWATPKALACLKFDVIKPYSFASYEGIVANLDTSRVDNGFGDPMARISLILIGAPAYTPAGFMQNERRKFKLGVVVQVRAPLGKYNSTKLLNLGANLWDVKLGLA